MRNNVVKKVLAATLACMMTFSMTTVAQAKGDKKSDKRYTIGGNKLCQIHWSDRAVF